MKEFMKMFDYLNHMNPSNEKNGDWMKNLSDNTPFDMNSINDYVQHSIEEAMKPSQGMGLGAESSSTRKGNQLDYEVIELMLYYIVKIRLTKDISIESVRITLGNCKLMVEGVKEERVAIPLPGQPSRRNISAQYREGMIEIRLHKKQNEDEKEIPVYY